MDVHVSVVCGLNSPLEIYSEMVQLDHTAVLQNVCHDQRHSDLKSFSFILGMLSSKVAKKGGEDKGEKPPERPTW